jgi:hypothetical protein
MITGIFEVRVHVEGIGDVIAGPDEYAGAPPGNGKAMEGFQITFHTSVGLGMRYMAHIRGQGDTEWLKDGEFAGNRDQHLPLEGFAIELTGSNFADYEVFYKAYNHAGHDTGWSSCGEFCGTRGRSLAIDGIVVRLVKRTPNRVRIISKAQSASGKSLVVTGHQGQRMLTVDAQTGSQWQIWDKRFVKARQGYVLISNADPTKCIARGPEQSTPTLVDIRGVTDMDWCTWRNDNVPGPYNAINCWTNWELKLNMRGNPPYPDQGSLLLNWWWACGADNELWKTMF